MNCKCRTCSNLKHGGTLLILDDSWFTLPDGDYELQLDQVAMLINATDAINNFSLFLIDYGYLEIIHSCAPYSKSDYSSQRPLIVKNLTLSSYKLNIKAFEHFKDVSIAYQKSLKIVINKYQSRELIIATCNRSSGFDIIDNKEVYYWNPYATDNKIIRRIFRQSPKHKIKRRDETETFCPIPDVELECALQRSVSMQSYYSFQNERAEICSYHEQYELIVKNKYTVDRITSLPNKFLFAYNALPLTVQEIEYHGFHIDSSTEEAQRIFQFLSASDVQVNPDIIKSKNEFKKRELRMLRDLA